MIYQTIFDSFKNSAVNACWNVVNYASIPSYFKTGYSTSQTYKKATFYWRIVNPVVQVSKEDLEKDIDNYFVDVLGINLNETTTPRGLINFYSAVSSYCSARLRSVGCLFTSTTYIVADLTQNIEQFTTIPEGILITATDVASITQNIFRIMSSSIRGYAIQYTIS